MNFASYPHDTQTCSLQMESRNFTCLQLTFKLKRRLGYYMFHTYIPTCLIVVMSWVSFWIKPEAVPARVTLGVTSLLTLCTQHAKSQADLPPVSYIKAIDIFMSSCTVFVFASLMEYAVVNVILEDGYKHFDVVRRRGDLDNPSEPSWREQGRLRALLIDRVSRVVFPTSFVFLNVFYWFFYVVFARRQCITANTTTEPDMQCYRTATREKRLGEEKRRGGGERDWRRSGDGERELRRPDEGASG
ncbi:hypothetical protein HPB51_010055 [Rhipicephalus microplus]|uniref:Neurotransmitter-gated ion-channel transmembrane domain-containing protein n=1 Tax=Rhipicephalus microplus TaxID=6941 RepID=A0A9J6E8D6_RHIMP|nr:hypothetical protein HPB51_010055 [Rhipicephalus microplus]